MSLGEEVYNIFGIGVNNDTTRAVGVTVQNRFGSLKRPVLPSAIFFENLYYF